MLSETQTTGCPDVFSNFAGQCDKNNDLHFVGHDVLHAEIVDPIDDGGCRLARRK